MKRIKRKAQIVVIVLAPLFFSACLGIQIIEDVKDPSRYFKKAYRQIEDIHRNYPNREGRPHRFHLLIYEGSDRQIIRLTVPLWLADACMDIGMEAAERENEFDFEDRYDFDWRGIKDLSQIGPGLLIEVEDEEDKILIWLE